MITFLGQQFGNYELTRLLGAGNFAQVYLGEHIYLNTPAAIKILNAQVEDSLVLFRTEARTIARLVHPNIVRVLEFGVEGNVPFLVLDYAPKGTLLAVPTIVSYTKQIAEALQYAHDERIVHRDVKPENLLLGRNDEVLPSDFGIALMSLTLRSTQQRDVASTPAYMAPEQLQQEPLPASDQYSLAVIVYEWFTGVLPFSGSFTEILAQQISTPPPPMRAIRPAISPAIEQVIMKALEKDPRQRYDSVRVFAQALEQASLTGTPPPRQAILPTLAVPVSAPGSRASLTRASDGPAAILAPLSSAPPTQPPALSQPSGTLVSTYSCVGRFHWYPAPVLSGCL